MQTLTTDELEALLDDDDNVQLIAVYSSRYFENMHLPGSVNIPLEELSDRASAELDPDAPVVVYCSSVQCNLSPQAADLLDRLGFDTVYDYERGLAEWLRTEHSVARSEDDATESADPRRH